MKRIFLVLLVVLLVAVGLSALYPWLDGGNEDIDGAPGGGLAPLAAPKGKVILTISGNIQVYNQGNKALFDLEMLSDIGESTIDTRLRSREGVYSFTGVEVGALLKRLGAEGRSVRLLALDNYTVVIEPEDYLKYHPVIASRINGEEIEVRDKGPLRLIFPWGSYPEELAGDEYYDKAIWQLTEVVVQ
ncbi:molybdopterin-dependent oxidoreductase [Kiloniella laminariae]|uniref:molybdopterin-dependent oxidoreductase n=1 Tax=Kiloniella laminariae TaxID=454162 RepID=UPI000373D016|nr:molybdopterin-dependent oxidoreductase [Kiloniella laminariae]